MKLSKLYLDKVRRGVLDTESGQAMVEFALCSGILMLATFMVADVARLCFTASAVQAAAQEGARAGIINVGAAESAAREKLELSAFTTMGQDESNAAVVSVDQPDTDVVQVSIEYEYEFVPPMSFFVHSFSLSRSARMIVR